jgi:hypothetical protein
MAKTILYFVLLYEPGAIHILDFEDILDPP